MQPHAVDQQRRSLLNEHTPYNAKVILVHLHLINPLADTSRSNFSFSLTALHTGPVPANTLHTAKSSVHVGQLGTAERGVARE